MLNEHRRELKNVEALINASIINEEEQMIANPVPPTPPAKATIERADLQRSKRLEKYKQVHALNQQGCSKIAIARKERN